MSTYRTIQLVCVGVIAVVFGASALARRFPHVRWLQRLRYDPPQLSEEEAARRRRRANVHTGIELILAGLALPLLYGVATVMFFNDFSTPALTLVLAGGALCVGVGISVIHRNRRD